jgi:hypothetical protein
MIDPNENGPRLTSRPVGAVSEETSLLHAEKYTLPQGDQQGGQVMSEKPEALRLVDDPTENKEMYLFMQAAELRRQHAEIERLTADNERLRGLIRHILGDRITPEAYLLFGKAWVDEAHAALRREET